MDANTNQPLISVVIPSKNRPHFLKVAVESVLQQTYQTVEVIVIDDGSTPAIQLADDSRITVIRFEKSRGSAAARNYGLQIAKGEYVAFLDDDDYYYPHKLAMQLAHLLAHPEVDLVFSKVDYIDKQGNKLCHAQIYKDWYYNFFYFNTIHTNASLFKKSILTKVKFNERLRKYTDMQFYLLASLRCTIHYLDTSQPVAVWNIDGRPDQLTAHGSQKRNYDNFKLICEDFADVLAQHPKLRWKYYKRLALYALYSLQFKAAFHAFYKML